MWIWVVCNFRWRISNSAKTCSNFFSIKNYFGKSSSGFLLKNAALNKLFKEFSSTLFPCLEAFIFLWIADVPTPSFILLSILSGLMSGVFIYWTHFVCRIQMTAWQISWENHPTVSRIPSYWLLFQANFSAKVSWICFENIWLYILVRVFLLRRNLSNDLLYLWFSPMSTCNEFDLFNSCKFAPDVWVYISLRLFEVNSRRRLIRCSNYRLC